MRRGAARDRPRDRLAELHEGDRRERRAAAAERVRAAAAARLRGERDDERAVRRRGLRVHLKDARDEVAGLRDRLETRRREAADDGLDGLHRPVLRLDDPLAGRKHTARRHRGGERRRARREIGAEGREEQLREIVVAEVATSGVGAHGLVERRVELGAVGLRERSPRRPQRAREERRVVVDLADDVQHHGANLYRQRL